MNDTKDNIQTPILFARKELDAALILLQPLLRSLSHSKDDSDLDRDRGGDRELLRLAYGALTGKGELHDPEMGQRLLQVLFRSLLWRDRANGNTQIADALMGEEARQDLDAILSEGDGDREIAEWIYRAVSVARDQIDAALSTLHPTESQPQLTKRGSGR